MSVENELVKLLLNVWDTQEESIRELERYKKTFPKETDYNVYQYGNILPYTAEIIRFYQMNGVNIDDTELEDDEFYDYVIRRFKYDVGQAVDEILTTYVTAE